MSDEQASLPIIVAIDGPSGVGKSTVARLLADRLAVPYLDTGAMYRAVGLKALREGVEPTDREAMAELVGEIEIGLRRAEDGAFQVLLDGEEVEGRIRTGEVAAAASAAATHSAVRRRMVSLQRLCARDLGGVLEGRDIGTKVFPDTPHKFFLDAQPEIRFRRRFLQLQERGREVPYPQVVQEVSDRDRRDRGRKDSPLGFDSSYTLVDASFLSPQEVVSAMLKELGAP